MKIYDVAVIGAGVAGCCTARELARFELSTVVLEAGNDIACGATRANSGIVHAGFDPQPGSLKARYNVAGAALFPQWSAELGFAYHRNGSMVVAFDDDELPALSRLKERGEENGVEGLSLLDGDEARKLEPNLSSQAVGALLVETGAICDPYDVALASAENAAANGVEFRFRAKVVGIGRAEGLFDIALDSGERVMARTVVNAAGVHADEMNNLVSSEKLSIAPVRGDYCLYDSEYGSTFGRTMFQVPTARGKGVLVSPTVHGNLFVGPTSVPQQDKDDLSTKREGLDLLIRKGAETWPAASTKGIITNFAGLRATGSTGDFVIGQPDDAPGFFNIACLESPGLTSAPAIAIDIARQVGRFLHAGLRTGFDPVRPATRRFAMMGDEERKAAIDEDPAWGSVVCRCCNVTEAELVSALHGPLPVLSLDTLKWRCGATMGPCHGGFCMPEIMRITCRELGIEPESLDKRLPGSHLVTRSRKDYIELAKGKERGASRPHVRNAYDVVVVGAGAAGLAAARKASEQGARVLLLDRERQTGGILRQCVHNGFGLHRFSEELTGPEYASREASALAERGIDMLLGATVLGLGRNGAGPLADDADGEALGRMAWENNDARFTVTLASPQGHRSVAANAVVLATGSRERGFGSLNASGSRPSGIYSAGSAQNLINLQGCIPGERAVVLGSGDIGLIMARRMTLEGMQVLGIYEIAAQASGLRRNIVQCLDDFGIPLHLSKTVTRIEGRHRLKAVWVSSVDPATWLPIEGTEERIECDTLVLSIGLIPENGLLKQLGASLDPVTGGAVVDQFMQTSVPGVFSCGNSLHIHDLADYASGEGDIAGAAAAQCALECDAEPSAASGMGPESAANPESAASDVPCIPIIPAKGVRYVVPHCLTTAPKDACESPQTPHNLSLSFRVSKPMRRPRFEVHGITAEGEKVLLAATTGIVAVPAEMVKLSLDPKRTEGWTRIEVSAFSRGEKR